MIDNIYVYDNAGVKLDDLTGAVSVQRSEKLSYTVEAARSFISINSKNAKATLRNLKTGNIIFVKSSEPTVKNMAGIVWPSDPNGYELKSSEIRIPLRSYEWVLERRATMQQEIISGRPAAHFMALLSAARRQGYLPISTEQTYAQNSGVSITREYNAAQIYQTINKLAADNSFYWWLSPVEDQATGLLEMMPTWRAKRSTNFQTQLSCGGDAPNLTVKNISDCGEVVNHVVVYGAGSSWTNRLSVSLKDNPSIGYYRQVFTKVIQAFDETTLDGLRVIAVETLNKYAFPLLRIDGEINAAPYPRVGDICSVVLPADIGFFSDRRGTIIKMQVESVVVTPQDASYTVRLMEIYDTEQ